jgi:hypothetical protein
VSVSERVSSDPRLPTPARYAACGARRSVRTANFH